MENQPINTVFISSRHYADLVESETTLNILRDILIDRLKIYGYHTELAPEIDFAGSGMEDVIKALFPEQYAKKARALLTAWREEHPNKADNAE